MHAKHHALLLQLFVNFNVKFNVNVKLYEQFAAEVHLRRPGVVDIVPFCGMKRHNTTFHAYPCCSAAAAAGD
jgi:hypothetical protein